MPADAVLIGNRHNVGHAVNTEVLANTVLNSKQAYRLRRKAAQEPASTGHALA